MPMLIKGIDQIAQEKGRDALYLRFIGSELGASSYKDLPARAEIIEWLDASGIAWSPCADPSEMTGYLSYQGHIYVDVAYEPGEKRYEDLCYFLGDDTANTGRTRLDDVSFQLFTCTAPTKVI